MGAEERPRRGVDTALVKSAQKGDKRAYEQLVRRYRGVVSALAYALTRNPSRTEELAQEIFVSAWSRLGGLRQPDRFPGWLFKIARNRIRDFERRRGTEALLRQSPEPFSADLPSGEPSPLDRIIRDEEESLVWTALARIPESYRVPLLLVYREGESIESVAETLELTVDNVRHRLSRGRKSLQGQWEALTRRRAARRRPEKAFVVGVLAGIAARSIAAPGRAMAAKTKAVAMSAVVTLAVGAAVSALVAAPSGRQSLPETRATLAAPSPRPPAVLVPVARPDPRVASVAEPDLSAYDFDFEDGIQPDVFSDGHLVSGPARPGNKHVMVGSILPFWATGTGVRIGRREEGVVVNYNEMLVVSFDYWQGADSNLLSVDIVDATQDGHYRMVAWREGSDHEKWAHAELRVADFRHAPRPGEPLSTPMVMEEGDALRYILFEAGKTGGKPFYVDNIKVFTAAPHEPPRPSSFMLAAR